MTADGTVLLDQPSAEARAAKAVWRQVRDHLVGQVATALDHAEERVARITVVAEDASLAGVVGRGVGRTVTAAEPGGHADAVGDHVVAVVVPPDLVAARRLEILRPAIGRLGVGGRLVVVATVVSHPDAGAAPSMAELAEELQLAAGGALVLDDMVSVRWDREPLRRGVVVRCTVLSLPREADDA